MNEPSTSAPPTDDRRTRAPLVESASIALSEGSVSTDRYAK